MGRQNMVWLLPGNSYTRYQIIYIAYLWVDMETAVEGDVDSLDTSHSATVHRDHRVAQVGFRWQIDLRILLNEGDITKIYVMRTW